ncbi:hypothetical protein GCM10010278_82100 [Streptomyces melanogenes]|nr:hypothetical protein GCM10010278_82100 [Streptomyces melanogenes]
MHLDLDAVTAGLALACGSSIVEGHVNRIKTIKRQIYGRASLPLLRTRILLRSRPEDSQNRGPNRNRDRRQFPETDPGRPTTDEIRAIQHAWAAASANTPG